MARLSGPPTPLRRGPTLVAGGSSPGRPTIEQVAERAGVSVATVSRALRGLPNVAPTTRARVAATAREMGYRADPLAARLASGRSRTIGVVVPMINSWYFASIVAGIEAVCAEDGYDLLIVCRPTPEQTSRTAMASLERRVDGLVFVEVPLRTEDVAMLAASGVAVVTVGQRLGPFSSVIVDNGGIGRMAADHLLDLGHRRIGVIGAQSELPAAFDVPRQRIDGVHDAMRARNIDLDPALIEMGEFTVEGGAAAGERLLRSVRPPTAIVALSDEMAFGAVAVARELGLSVPADVSVIGVDDHDAAAAVGLTTIRQNVGRQGALAARALLSGLADGSHVPARLSDDVELIVRETTARNHHDPALTRPTLL